MIPVAWKAQGLLLALDALASVSPPILTLTWSSFLDAVFRVATGAKSDPTFTLGMLCFLENHGPHRGDNDLDTASIAAETESLPVGIVYTVCVSFLLEARVGFFGFDEEMVEILTSEEDADAGTISISVIITLRFGFLLTLY